LGKCGVFFPPDTPRRQHAAPHSQSSGYDENARTNEHGKRFSTAWGFTGTGPLALPTEEEEEGSAAGPALRCARASVPSCSLNRTSRVNVLLRPAGSFQ